nr:ribonuclease H-like domain-containing protein [Tanacetum cinerariifolium]
MFSLSGFGSYPSRQVMSVAKLLILNPNEFDLWKMRIEQLARKNELQARGTLLMALPDKYQLMFNIHKDAKTLMEAIEKRFGGNKETKKDSYPYLEEQSLDDLFNSLKIYEAEVKSSSSASTSTQNIAFVSSQTTDSTNDSVSAVASVSTASAKIHVFALPNVDTLRRNLRANGPTSMVFDMSKVECYNCHRKGHFAKECRSPKDTRRNGAAEPQRRNVLVDDESLPPSPIYDRYQSGDGYHAVPPPYTGTFMPPKPDLVFHNALNVTETVHTAFNVEPSPTKLDNDLSPTHRPTAPIIKDWVSDSEDDSEAEVPHNATSFVQPIKQVKTPRLSVKTVETSIPTANTKTTIPKPKNNGNRTNRKTCFVCNSLDHLVKDSKTVVTKPHSPPRRNINRSPSPKASNFPPKVTAVKAPMVNVVKGVQGKWEWKPKCLILDHVSRNTSTSMTLKRFDYNDALGRSKYVAFGGNLKGGKISGKGIENQLSLKVKIIISDNGTELKNNDLNQFCGMKGIKREFSVPRTPQQNGIVERKNRTLNEAARTMLADSLLPIPFWAEVVNTACYAQNMVLVTKPQNKTPYELLLGRTSSIGFMRPFGCPITILNTLDPLGKFNGSGPTWLFDIDTLTRTMNYQPVTAGNQSNPRASVQEQFDTEKAREKNVQQYVLFPVWSSGSNNPQNTDGDATFEVKEPEFEGRKPQSEVHVSSSSSAQTKKHDNKTKRQAKGKIPAVGQILTNSTNTFSAAGPLNATVCPTHGKSSYVDAFQYPDDLNMPELEDITYSDDEEDVGAEDDFTNLETTITVSPIPTIRVHKDHPVTQIIGNLSLATQTRSMKRVAKDQAMQDELLQFKMQKVWVLVNLPHGKRAIGTKWVFRNKKDERGIVVRIKARLVAQGHTQEEGMIMKKSLLQFAFLYETIEEEVYVCQPPGFEDPDYPDKVYKVVKALYELHQAPRAWFETLASYLLENGFQRGKIDQTLFIKRQKAKILRKFGLTNGKSASTPIDTEKPLLKDPDRKDVNDVMRLQALVDKKKVIITKDTIRDALRLDDAEGIDCPPNEEIFAELSRMGTSWNEFSSSMASAVICLSIGRKFNFSKYIFDSLVGDLSSHTTKYSSPAVTQKVFANMRKVGNGFSGVNTPLFEGMIVAQQADEGAAKVNVDDVPTAGVADEGVASINADAILTTAAEPIISSLTPPTQPQPPSQDLPSTSQDAEISMDLLYNLLDTCTTLTERVKNIEQDKITQALEIIKLKQKEVAVDAEIEESADVQGRQAESQVQIYQIDLEHADKVLSMQDDEVEPAELQEVVEVVTTAKLITEVVTAASATIIDAALILTTVAALTLTTTPNAARRRKGVVIRDPEETVTPSTIIHTKAKSKDKGKGILVEEPKPLKKQAQIEQDEAFVRELTEELSKTINWDDVIDQVQRKEKEDNVVMRYQALKRKPQNEAQAIKNMMIYLRNMDGFKMDYFKGMKYDDIPPIFEKYFNSNVAFLDKTREQMEKEDNKALKRISESQEDKAAKKQKLNEEVAKLKRHLRIVPDDEEDVYTEATPLAHKAPVVDYEIYTENNKPYYKIKRANGTHQLYLSFLACLEILTEKT